MTVTLSNDQLEVNTTAAGGEMQSLKARGRETLWQGDPAWWSGRAPILFPIIGPGPDGRISVGDFEAEMGQHGPARKSPFTLAAQDDLSCLWVLDDSEATRAQFPFAFRLELGYRLDGGTLTASAEVINTGDRPFPFQLGFHPAFAWPLPGGEGQPHEITLANGAEPALARIDGPCLPDTRLPSPFRAGRLTLDPAQFEADAMIFPDGAGPALSYGVADGPRLDFRFDNLPHLAIWQKPGAPFLCIEPWQGMHALPGTGNQLADRPGALILAPGARHRAAWSVTPRL